MTSPNRQFAVQVSMLEIYNEIVHDLFTHPSQRNKGGLEVREDNSGPFVKQLTLVPVQSYQDIDKQIQRGNTNRTIGATNMNATSSRAHTIVTISIRQTILNESKNPVHTLNTKINLVDLAGSERIAATGAVGGRLKEGTNINKSLSVLGKVISCLAQKSQGKAKSAVVPYRESKLTRILQNNLGGNSKTAMIAAISPSSVNYQETLSTLRYAYQVKSIKNKAFLNQNPLDRVVRELRNQNKALRLKLDDGLVGSKPIKFEEPEWKGRYHLKNLNQDPLLTGKIRHVLQDGITRIGTKGDVEVGGLGVVSQHCRIELDESHNEAMLIPNDSSLKHQTLVNGKLVTEPIRLKHNDRVRFGLHNYFVYLAPGEVEGEQYNWEYANQEAVDNNVKEIEAKSHLETLELKAKLKELEGLVKEKAQIEQEMRKKMEHMENDHKQRMDTIKKKYAKLMETAQSDEQQ